MEPPSKFSGRSDATTNWLMALQSLWQNLSVRVTRWSSHLADSQHLLRILEAQDQGVLRSYGFKNMLQSDQVQHALIF